MRIKLECKNSKNIHIVTAALMAAYYTGMTIDELLAKLKSSPKYNTLSELSNALQRLEDIDPRTKELEIIELELADVGFIIKVKEK